MVRRSAAWTHMEHNSRDIMIIVAYETYFSSIYLKATFLFASYGRMECLEVCTRIQAEAHFARYKPTVTVTLFRLSSCAFPMLHIYTMPSGFRPLLAS